MRIVRGPRMADNFTVLDNALLRDDRLSYRARGLLCDLLSHPDGWSVDAHRLAARSPSEGRRAILSALSELERVGYLQRVRVQNPETGRWQWEQAVFEHPQPRPAGNPKPDDGLSTDHRSAVMRRRSTELRSTELRLSALQKSQGLSSRTVSQVMSSPVPEPAVTPPVPEPDPDVTDPPKNGRMTHREELAAALADVPRDTRPGLTTAMRAILDNAHARGWTPQQLRDQLANDRNDYAKCGPGAIVARLRALSHTDPEPAETIRDDTPSPPCNGHGYDDARHCPVCKHGVTLREVRTA